MSTSVNNGPPDRLVINDPDSTTHNVSDDERIDRIKRRLEKNMSLNLLNLPRRGSADRPKSPGLMKLSSFQRTKFDYMFDTLYAPTQSDVVCREDFWKLLKTAVKLRAWSPIHPGFRDLQMRIASIWAGLIKGTLVYKPEGQSLLMQIKREEWHHYWGDFVEAATLCQNNWPESSKDGRIDYQCQRDFRDFMFSVLDVNGDGAIDKNEFTTCLAAFGICESDSEESFERIMELLPRNQNKSKWEKYITKSAEDEDDKASAEDETRVTETDFDQLWCEYLTSNDRTKAGNYILGPSPLYL